MAGSGTGWALRFLLTHTSLGFSAPCQDCCQHPPSPLSLGASALQKASPAEGTPLTSLFSIRSHTTLLLKYWICVHLIPSCTYSSWGSTGTAGWAPSPWDVLQTPCSSCGAGEEGGAGIGVQELGCWHSPTALSPAPLYLLSLQGELDEDLLQLLVHKVNAELLEAVFLHEGWKRKWC